MDSVTQIVLGAAVAEATIGKKIGNRAIVWGAIAGTIPDLDVLSNFFLSPVDALAFHRGPTHSFLLCVILAVLLGWAVHRMYSLPYHKWFGIISWTVLVSGIGMMAIVNGRHSVTGILTGLIILLLPGYIIYKRYTRTSYTTAEAPLTTWIWMFLLVLVTHPILDCFTTYGTQFLLPFSDRRIAFNNIAVADPIYTIPFLGCVISAMFYSPTSRSRRFWNNTGLVISSMYMIFTIFNKTRVNTIFENTLTKEGIRFSRYMTTPTILNNVLWSGIAETDSAFYYGMYSFFDSDKSFKIKKLEKSSSEYTSALANDPTLKTLRWFSDDYFVLQNKNADTLEYYDLRFGTFRMKASDPDQFVFKFNIEKQQGDRYYLIDQGARPRDADFSEAFGALWARMMGKY